MSELCFVQHQSYVFMEISVTLFACKCNNYQTEKQQNGSSYIFLLSKHTEDQTGAIYRKEHCLPFLLLAKCQESFKVIAFTKKKRIGNKRNVLPQKRPNFKSLHLFILIHEPSVCFSTTKLIFIYLFTGAGVFVSF